MAAKRPLRKATRLNPAERPSPEAPSPPPPVTDQEAEQAHEAHDDAEARPRKSVPTRGRRYEVFDDNQGNYRWYQVTTSEHANDFPVGSLLPIPNIPGFKTAADAKKFIRSAGNLLLGKHILLFRAVQYSHVDREDSPRITIRNKPRTMINDPL